MPAAHVASAMGIFRQCAHKWWCRYQELGEERLFDRSSRPHRQPTRRPPLIEERIVRRRQVHLTILEECWKRAFVRFV
jgi:hypothetical protein